MFDFHAHRLILQGQSRHLITMIFTDPPNTAMGKVPNFLTSLTSCRATRMLRGDNMQSTLSVQLEEQKLFILSCINPMETYLGVLVLL